MRNTTAIFVKPKSLSRTGTEMADDRLYILQSGFVAVNFTNLEATPEKKETLRDSLFASDFRIGDTVNLYDEGVEQLFQIYHKDNAIVRNFDFRERVIKTAIRAFDHGSDSIIPWIRAQLTQRTVGYIHRKFLYETIQFVLNKKPRTLDLMTYHRLIEAEDVGNRSQPGSDKPNEALENYVKSNQDCRLSRFIYGWVGSIDGYVDLLKTLEVIFGKREGYLAPVRHVED